MKFVPESYLEADQLGKDLLVNYLKGRGYEIIDTTESYDHDIIASLNGEKVYFEVELKYSPKYAFTKKGTFPFSSVSFLGRKKRLHDKHPFHYVIISSTGWAVSCHSSEIFKDEYMERVMINTNRRQGEDIMFRVPVDKCYFLNVANEQ